MTRLLEQAVEAVSALPDEAQDDLARISCNSQASISHPMS
jgi:hypothetical protein